MVLMHQSLPAHSQLQFSTGRVDSTDIPSVFRGTLAARAMSRSDN
jgi:hypothetical protein